MTFDACIAFFTVNFLFSLPPGPNMAIIARATSRSGLQSGMAALGGVVLAEVFWALLALGVVSGLLDREILPESALQTLSAAALTCLGALMIRDLLHGRNSQTCATATPDAMTIMVARAQAGRSGMMSAVIVGLTNPVTLVFYVSVAPLFLDSERINGTSASLFIVVSLLACFAAHAPALAVASLPRAVSGKAIEWVCGASLCAMGGYGLVHIAYS